MIDVRLQIEGKREPHLKPQAGGLLGSIYDPWLQPVALILPTLRRPGQLPGGLILTTYVYCIDILDFTTMLIAPSPCAKHNALLWLRGLAHAV